MLFPSIETIEFECCGNASFICPHMRFLLQDLVFNAELYLLFGNFSNLVSAKNFINSCCRLEEVCPGRSFILAQYCPHKFPLWPQTTHFHFQPCNSEREQKIKDVQGVFLLHTLQPPSDHQRSYLPAQFQGKLNYPLF